MYAGANENKIVVIDITDTLTDHCPIQPDIDEKKIKAAQLLAQNIDLKRVIGKENVERCVVPVTPEDEELREKIIPALCWFTYSRLTRQYSVTFTDGGMDSEGLDMLEIKRQADIANDTAETYLKDVVEELEEQKVEGYSEMDEKMVPKIRTFGGEEWRASN